MNKAPRRLACLVGPAVLAVALAACSSTPAVCSDLDSVHATVHKLQNLQPGQTTLGDLQHDLQTLDKQVRQLADDASQQYAAQVSAVRASVRALQTGVSAAVSQPSGAAVSQLRTELKQVESSVKNLSSALSTTC
jgi:hypothetical protein